MNRPYLPKKLKLAEAEARLDRAGFFQRFVGAVFIDCLQSAGSYAHANEFFQFRYPDPVLVKIGPEPARHILGHVPADTALFLGHTAAMNDAAAHGFRTGDIANFRHGAR
jgi:hypothetical protein